MYTMIIILLLANFLTHTTGTQAQNFDEDIKNSINCLEDDITSALDRSPNEQITLTLENIRTNLIVSRTFHDNINGRELQNMYVCWRNAFNEVSEVTNRQQNNKSKNADEGIVLVEKLKNLLNASQTTDKVVTAPLNNEKFQLTKNQTKNIDEFIVLMQELENTTSESLNLPDVGEFVQAVDTLAHFVQTRFQHDRKHADLYAKSSTTLIKAILAQQHPLDLKKAIAVLLVEIRNIADLAQTDLNESAQAHVELFLSGLINLLYVMKNQSRPSLEFCIMVFQHLVESILEGKDDVKQALAIQAHYFKKHALEFGYNISLQHDTKEIKQNFVNQVLWATSTRQSSYISIIQSINVQLLNTFRLSHEDNLQVLFFHLTGVLLQTPGGEPFIDVLQQILIESYRTGVIEPTTTIFRKLLILLQRRLLNSYFK